MAAELTTDRTLKKWVFLSPEMDLETGKKGTIEGECMCNLKRKRATLTLLPEKINQRNKNKSDVPGAFWEDIRREEPLISTAKSRQYLL